jgi:hypothetical protein
VEGGRDLRDDFEPDEDGESEDRQECHCLAHELFPAFSP